MHLVPSAPPLWPLLRLTHLWRLTHQQPHSHHGWAHPCGRRGGVGAGGAAHKLDRQWRELEEGVRSCVVQCNGGRVNLVEMHVTWLPAVSLTGQALAGVDVSAPWEAHVC